jgi:integrase
MSEDFEIKLMKKLKEKKLADTSVNYYLRNLRKLNDDKEIKNLNFLSNKEKINKFIESKKPNTQRNYYITIVSVLGTDDKKKALKTYYTNHMDQMNKDLKEKEGKNEKSETQKKNWIEEDEIKSIYNKYKESVDKFKNEKNISDNKFDTLLKYVILSLYVLIPPRRNKDYQDAFLVKNTPEKEFDEDFNYVDLTKKNFVFNNFKTKKTEGQKIIDIPNELMEVLEIYAKHHPLIDEGENTYDVPFLVNYDGEPLTNVNAITYLLNSIFKKNIGSSMLRHLYLSHKYGDTIKEQKKDAEIMGHSVSQQKDYVKLKK